MWVHAASLGEAKLLYKFLEVLVQRHPEDLYLVTATTRAGVQYLQTNRTSQICAVGFLPLDTLPLMRKVIEYFDITRVWLLETELWPSMLLSCRQKAIPVGIVNARMEERSFERYRKFQKTLQELFGCFDIVLAQNEVYANRFAELGVKRDNIHVVGNIKGHISIRRPAKREWQALRRGLNLSEHHFVLTAGCVHAGEGRALRVAIDLLREREFPCKLIVVPRHLQEVPVLLEELGKDVVHLHDIATSRKWDICIIEKFGILDDMYKVADAAFVGGTFVNTGGHNMWDPARFGIPVFFGPDYHTQKDSCEKLMTAGVGFRAESAEEMAQLIYKVVKVEARRFVNAQLLFMETINKGHSILEPLIP